jgi:hypothetical protein
MIYRKLPVLITDREPMLFVSLGGNLVTQEFQIFKTFKGITGQIINHACEVLPTRQILKV